MKFHNILYKLNAYKATDYEQQYMNQYKKEQKRQLIKVNRFCSFDLDIVSQRLHYQNY